MNLNSSIFLARKHSKRNSNLTLFSNAEGEHCDKDCIPFMDYMHINLLYCGGTVTHIPACYKECIHDERHYLNTTCIYAAHYLIASFP